MLKKLFEVLNVLRYLVHFQEITLNELGKNVKLVQYIFVFPIIHADNYILYKVGPRQLAHNLYLMI